MDLPSTLSGNMTDETIGTLLLIGGLLMLAAEVFITSFGLLGLGGLALFLIGAHHLFVGEALWIAWGIAVTLALFMMIAGATVLKSYRSRPVSGIEGMIGETAEIIEWHERDGLVRINGELWQASSVQASTYEAGDKVVISTADDLILKTRKPD